MLYLTPVLTDLDVEKGQNDIRQAIKDTNELLNLLTSGEKEPAELIGEFLEVDTAVDRDGEEFTSLTFSVDTVFRKGGHLYAASQSIAVDLTVLAEVERQRLEELRPSRPKLGIVKP